MKLLLNNRLTIAVIAAGLISSCNSGQNIDKLVTTNNNQDYLSSELNKIPPQAQDINTDNLPLIPNEYLIQQPSWSSCKIKDFDLSNQQQIDLYKKRIKTLGDQLKCATIKVPLDYANPAKGSIYIAVSKYSHETINKESGIFFNPGGPGGSGLWYPVAYGALWSDAEPDNLRGEKLLELIRTYDLIGFAPRGVGAGGAVLNCLLNNNQYKQTKFLGTNRSEENTMLAYQNARLSAKACKSSDLTHHINTDNTARDLDLMRHVLGYAKLNYIGYSYGTWLGMWYASLFPEKVNKILLDSSIDFQMSRPEIAKLKTTQTQIVFDDLVIPYVAQQNHYNLPKTVAEIKNISSIAIPDLKKIISDSVFKPLYKLNDENRKTILEVLTASHAINKAFSDSIDKNAINKQYLQNKLSNYVYHSESKKINDSIETRANKMVETLYPEKNQALLKYPSMAHI